MIRQGGSDAELYERIARVLASEAQYGLVVVMDENGLMDFALNVTVKQVHDAMVEYARDVLAYKKETTRERETERPARG